MTSFVLKPHEDRALPAAWVTDPLCPFCCIVAGTMPAYRLFEDEMVVAILDIAPLRPGHTLVIPKTHVPRVSDLPDAFAAECGRAVSRLARALAAALQNTALNVVCNQEYMQAVPHVHYHIIPAPRRDPGSHAGESAPVPAPPAPGVPGGGGSGGSGAGRPLTEKEMHWREMEARGELREEDAARIVEMVRAQLAG